MKKQRLSSEDRRSQIIQEARSLFAKKGYAEVSLDSIAAKVGVSRPRILQLFGSKLNIYMAIADAAYRSHSMNKDLAGPIEKNDDLGVFEAFAAHVLKHTRKREGREIFKISLYASFKGDFFHKLHFQEKEMVMMSRLQEYVNRRIREGVFRKSDPKIIIFCYHAMIWNIVMYKNMMKQMDFVSLEDLSRECARIFVDGLINRVAKKEKTS